MDRVRTCIGCRRKAQKGSMARIARRSDGTVYADLTGRGPGRGAYVCSPECLSDALGNGSLARALRCRIAQDACDRLREDSRGFSALAHAKGSKE